MIPWFKTFLNDHVLPVYIFSESHKILLNPDCLNVLIYAIMNVEILHIVGENIYQKDSSGE